MNYFSIIALLLIFRVHGLAQQGPAFRYWPDTGDTTISTRYFPQDVRGAKLQMLYYPSGFPGMPAGAITCVYLRRQYPSHIYGKIAQNLRIRMGNVGDSLFKASVTDVVKTGLTTLLDTTNYTIDCMDSIDNWVRFPLTRPFLYTPKSNFVFEIFLDTVDGHPLWYGSEGSLTNKRSLWIQGKPAVRYFDTGYTNSWVPDIGFDIDGDFPTAILPTVSNIKEYKLYPNPSHNGRFYIYYSTGLTIHKATVTVSDISGKLVSHNVYTNGGTQFSKEIDISHCAKGVYFVRLEADGEVQTQSVDLQ